MGYCMQQLYSNVEIKAENLEKAAEAIRALRGKETCHDDSGTHFSWVSHDFHELQSFKELMEEWGWSVQFEDDGSAYEIEFEREKLGDEVILFGAIAPFVEPGGWIEMQGEDGERWRWFFDGQTVVEQNAKITYE